MRRPSFALAAVALLFSTQCGGGAGDGALPSSGKDGGAGGGDGALGGGDAGDTSCNGAAIVASIAQCIDSGKGPKSCLDAARAGDAGAPCDADADGMDDALEDALMRSYAPTFAYNKGDGSHTAGSTEPNWPINVAHYVAASTVLWRLDNDASTVITIDPAPTLATLPGEKNGPHLADSPVLGAGPNFWLCLNKPGGNYPADALVPTIDASRNLVGGVELFASVHMTSTDPQGRYAVVGYMLYYAYNAFTLDNHEGDWEGGAVFVDLESGDVAAIDTERHNTSDSEKLVPLTGPGALTAMDPSTEAPHYDVCSATTAGPIGGVRFWDFGGKRHHPVFFPSAGAHASYAYPGATKIQGIGCVEATIIRDVHNGQAEKLVPQDGAFYAGWNGTGTKSPIMNGLHFVNIGEPTHVRAPFTAFAGQWGCTYESIPKSYPGPWDNERLCRHWLTNDWGKVPPFTPSKATTCTP